jgi:hypothetical protein
MVIHEKFAYGHIPRTGGSAIHLFLEIFAAELGLKMDLAGDHSKHDPFSIRGIDNSRLLVLSCRRLPSWYISWTSMAINTGINTKKASMVWQKPHLEDLLNPNSKYNHRINLEFGSSFATLPDAYLHAFTSGGKLRIDQWFKVDSGLVMDIQKFVSSYVVVTDAHRQRLEQMRLHTLGMVKKQGYRCTAKYNHDVFAHFTPEEVAILYKNNPHWASIEEQVFGNLIQWEDGSQPPVPEPQFWTR